jgi:hypothetical protein
MNIIIRRPHLEYRILHAGLVLVSGLLKALKDLVQVD